MADKKQTNKDQLKKVAGGGVGRDPVVSKPKPADRSTSSLTGVKKQPPSISSDS